MRFAIVLLLAACTPEPPPLAPLEHLPVVQQYEYVCVDGVETIYYTNEAGRRFGPELTGARCDPDFQRRPRKADL